jgi:starch-binding outer membrane protein, SusD/RagB family
MKKYKIQFVLLIMLLATACSSDFLEPTLSTAKDVKGSVASAGDLNSLLVGALDVLNGTTYYGRDFVVYNEVRSDNAYSNGNSGRYVGPAQFFLNPTDGYPTSTWNTMYQVIAPLNIIINTNLEDAGDGAVNYIKGQAHTIRALVLMDLTRLYGQHASGGTLGVPIVLEFNDGNIYPERATLAECWAQVGADLEKAVALMNPTLNDGSVNKVNSWTPKALQSRYYLYTKEWAKAKDAAKAVIDGGNFSLASPWSANNSTDAIFELAYTPSDNLGITSLQFIYQATVYGDVPVTQDLVNQYDANDQRKDLFYTDTEGETRTKKYPSSDYLDAVRIIRYAEVLLNYAEALTQLSDTNALTALNVIPNQRGANLYGSATVDNILSERRKELAMEGHRFYDLMRYERDIVKVDPNQSFPDEGIPFGDYRLTFPIPAQELLSNPKCVQNTGY